MTQGRPDDTVIVSARGNPLRLSLQDVVEAATLDGTLALKGESLTLGDQTISAPSINRRAVDVADDAPSSDIEDASDAIQEALTRGGGREVIFSNPRGGTRYYRVLSRSAANMVLANHSRIIVEPGAVIDFSAIGASGTQKAFFSGNGEIGDALALATDASAGDNTIELTAGLGAVVAGGDMLLVSSAAEYATGLGTIGEYVRVESVAGDVATLYGNLQGSYAVADTAVVRVVNPLHVSIEIEGKILGPGRFSGTYGDRGIELSYATGRIIGGEFGYIDYQTIVLDSCFNFTVEEVTWWHDSKGAGDDVQYGITYKNACQTLAIKNNSGYGGKHGIVHTENSLPGVSRDIKVLHNTIRGTWHAGCAVHDEVEDLLYEGNRLIDTNVGFDHRVRKVRSIGNKVTGVPNANVGVGHLLAQEVEDFFSVNDEIRAGRYAVRLPTGTPIASSGGPQRIRIYNLLAEGQTQRALELVNGAGATRKHVEVRNLKTENQSGLSFYFEGLDEVVVDGFDLERATASGACGQTVTCNDVKIRNGQWNSNYNPPSLTGTKIETQNIGQWGATTAPIRTINVAGTVTLLQEFSALAANSGTTDDLDNITLSAYGAEWTIMADAGDTITVRNNAGGTGNIYTRTGADVVLSGGVAMKVKCNGTTYHEI